MVNPKPPLLVVPGVFQLALPLEGNPLGYVLVYYLPGPLGNTLIDTGWNDPASLTALEEQLGMLGARVTDLQRLIVTHTHPDHAGLAETLRLRSGAPLLMHPREGELLQLRHDAGLFVQREAWLQANGFPREELPELPSSAYLRRLFPDHADAWLEEGQEIPAGRFRLQVLHTPGHSRGHICLYEHGQELFWAGDHVLPGITPNVSLGEAVDANPLGDYLASLDRIAALPVRLVLPGHEGSFSHLAQRVQEIRQHHRERGGEILRAVEAQGSTAYRLARQVTWSIGDFQQLDPWSKMMAVLEVLAHVELARREGLLRREENGGKTVYCLAKSCKE